jgi:hypothetical protein
MTELEELKLKVEHLDDRILELELRLKNAMTFIEIQNKQASDDKLLKERADANNT